MSSQEYGSEAESLFARLLEEAEGAVDSRLEALCRARPELASALREIRAGHSLAERARGELGLGPSVVGPSVVAFELPDREPGAFEPGPRPAAAPARLAELAARSGRRLELGRELGRGGMGQVLEARDPDLGRTLALKRIRRDVLPADERDPRRAHVLQRFLAEAQVTAQLEHPGIVPVHDVGVDERGEPFYTMARIEGEDLGRVFELARADRDGWSVPRAVELVVRVAETLAYAHEQGVVHRDLKPSNVRVGRLGQVYVTDWGLARVLGADPESPAPVATDRERAIREGSPLATREGLVPGTPEYMAPEQAAGRATEVGPRTDVYALGALLYELLAARAPHPRGDSSPEELRRRAASETPVALARLAPAAPPELVAIADKAMAREPASRYASALELAADLRAWLEGRVVRAHKTGAWIELVKWTRRNRLAAAAICAALVLLVAGLATALVLGEKERESARLAARFGEEAEAQRLEAEARRVDAERQAELAREEARRAEHAEAEVRRRPAESHMQNARLARQRGAWASVLASLEGARGAGWPDEVGLALEEARALHVLVRIEEARTLLEGLERREDLDQRRGEVLLQLGDLDLPRSRASPLALRRIEEALRLGLPPADESYARALLAPTVPEAEAHLRAAILHDPLHYGAQRLLLVVLAFTGHRQEALSRTEILRALNPEDHVPDVAVAFLHAIEGRLAESERAADAARARLDGEGEALLALLVEVGRAIHENFPAVITFDPQGPSVLEAIGQVNALAGEWSKRFPEAMERFQAPILPCLRDSFGEAFAGMLAMMGLDDLFAQARALLSEGVQPKRGNWAKALPYFRRAAAASPDAIFLHLQAGCTFLNDSDPDPGQYRGAEALWSAASEAPSIIPEIQRQAKLWATLSQLRIAANEGDAEMLGRGLAGLRHFAGLPDLRSHEIGHLTTYALNAGLPEAVLALQAAAKTGRPTDAAGWRLRAELYRAFERPQQAAGAYEQALALDPDDAEARTLLDALRPPAGSAPR